ncbi:hypothetical protein UFOVP203_45 [uncultured Caudovirales phage]|uniref:Uncharacterized protein n=1 Tax=uncultured Caudovirales phage TaxID=2100421 RepID=A0A6J7WK05_9CAUD|nr:hypothetical protein UFOVP203_45 [uncultured Caudovirales phage]
MLSHRCFGLVLVDPQVKSGGFLIQKKARVETLAVPYLSTKTQSTFSFVRL